MRLLVILLRSARHWNQRELAEAAGIDKARISLYELGRKVPSRRTLKRLAEAAGFSLRLVEQILPVLRLFDDKALVEAPAGAPLDEADAIAARVGRTVSDVARAASAQVLALLRTDAVGPGNGTAPNPEDERDRAAALWDRLAALTAQHQQVLVEGAREFQNWALCERICGESVKLAPREPARAKELAELAVRAAHVAPGTGPRRSCLQGYAWAHVANARRVANDLPAAEEAFVRARKLWEAGGPSGVGPLSEWRLLDLEASLRRDQRQFRRALELLDRALGAHASDVHRGRLLLKRAFTLEQMGAVEQAVVVLQEATSFVDQKSEPRLLFGLRFNLAVNLCHLGRHAEAEPLVPEVRELAAGLENDLDLVRVRWLEGRVAAGLGRSAEALAALQQVRSELVARGLAYDVALVTLELAVLLAEEDLTAEVQALARECAPIFRAQGVRREALAALQVFCQAAEREALTAEVARRLLRDLNKAVDRERQRPDNAG